MPHLGGVVLLLIPTSWAYLNPIFIMGNFFILFSAAHCIPLCLGMVVRFICRAPMPLSVTRASSGAA